MENKLPLHCSLDELLNGGLEAGIITEIYGEGGSGKTNICIQAAKSCVLEGKKAVYIDTEGISKERLLQVLKDRATLEQNLFFSPFSLKEQEEMVAKAVKIDAGLIVLDSANLFYRLEMHENEAAATRSLTKQLVTLQIEARKKNIPVIITSQVYSAGDEIKPFAGRSIDHIAKTIIRIEKAGDAKEKRKATIIKHRSLPEGKSTYFLITKDGIE
ncbi:MAG: DNA repair and recombination protein RadB [Thermoplasmata archaeon]|nr:MAG: DNA repair and recombination protein RadB [Thermoplasmata archaeon]RLF31284.1 MAG: DNA repair and recombination protein RadB [Thermoplasmata archaeon]